jgi:hypothetical protein
VQMTAPLESPRTNRDKKKSATEPMVHDRDPGLIRICHSFPGDCT